MTIKAIVLGLFALGMEDKPKAISGMNDNNKMIKAMTW